MSGASPELTDASVAIAPALGQQTLVLDGVSLPLRPNPGAFTQPTPCVGLPVAAMPVRLDDGLRLNVQVIAAPWREGLALRVARALEAGNIASIPGTRS